METKFCEDCIHYRLTWFERLLGMQRFAECNAITRNDGDRLVARKVNSRAFCSSERNPAYDSINKCGSRGALFQRKGEPSPVKDPEPPKPPIAARKLTPIIPFRNGSDPRKEDLN
jgi:hypothetical protein